MTAQLPLVAVDVGNTRIKLGRYDELDGEGLPQPTEVLRISTQSTEFDEVHSFLADRRPADLRWHIGSVNRGASGRLIDWLRQQGASEHIVLLTCRDLPLEVRLDRPDMVGIDRLLAAVAVNRLRDPNRPATIVELGTAMKVDLVSTDGAFLGGAILPGAEIAARALHDYTDLLPLIDLPSEGQPPPALGRSTVEAMRSGLYWGALGGVRELIAQYAELLGVTPQVYLSGGAAASVARPLAESATIVADLTLAGIALSALR